MRWSSLVIFCFEVYSVYTCNWLRDVNVTITEIAGNNSFSQLISGCINDVLFPNETVKVLLIRNQDIKFLGENTVKKMETLETLSFWGCPIENITPNLVHQAPNLKNFQISYGNIKKLPNGAFNNLPALELLRIHNNRINLIEDRSLTNLRNLKRIHADNNKLEIWKREWFTNTTNLEVLNFQVNRISEIPRRAFENLHKLTEIYFDFNKISTIHPEAFKGIRKLNYLGLRYNQLAEIKGDIFPDKLDIYSLLLDSNYLNFLSKELLKKITVKYVTLNNNPWKCPCLDIILIWMNQNNGTVRYIKDCFTGRIPVCTQLSDYPEICLEYVDPQLTEKYLNALESIDPPLSKSCTAPRTINKYGQM